LCEEDQKMLDGMWNNMLTPVNRVHHQTLLDTTLVNMMFQLGVDRLHLVSEKHLEHGKAVMEIDCDRASPKSDQFTIAVLDDRGRTLRRERYSRLEVEESAQALTPWPTTLNFGPHPADQTQPFTPPATEPATRSATTQPAECPETPDQRQRRLEYERRSKAVQAATQPAMVR
jgi:hypothetical protein